MIQGCTDIQYYHWLSVSCFCSDLQLPLEDTHTHTLSRNVQINAHSHKLLPHSGGNVSQKSGVIIVVTRPWGQVEWRLGESTMWKRMDVMTRCQWEVRMCTCAFVYERKRDRLTDWFNIDDDWFVFYCVYCVWCVNTRDGASVCVHVCMSVYQYFQIHPGQPSTSLKQSQRAKTMTSHLVTIVTLAINLTTSSVILFTGNRVHWADIWSPLSVLQHLDIHPVT